jgi:CHAD domain-containing protein
VTESAAAELERPPRRLRADDDAGPAARLVLGRLAADQARHLPGTLDRGDPEDLHQLRVAIRQTRSILRELAGILPAEVRDPHRELFGDLARATGDARDLDVLLEGWPDLLAELPAEDREALAPVRAELVRRQDTAHAALAAVFTDPVTVERLDAWRAWIDAPGEQAADPSIGAVVAHRVRRLHRHVLRDGRRITPGSPPEALHDLRKEAKRLRYVIECFGDLYDPRLRKRFLAHLKDLQDNLGAHQDAEVQAGLMRELALTGITGAPPQAAFALGQLAHRLDRQRAKERAAFARRFPEFDRRRNRDLLERMLASARRG